MSTDRSTVTDEGFRAQMNELILKTRDFLHDNWNTIESEAQRGAHAPRLGEETHGVPPKSRHRIKLFSTFL